MDEQASGRSSYLDPSSKRISVTLACCICKARNYKTTKSANKTLEIKKFCKQCHQHTLHRETK